MQFSEVQLFSFRLYVLCVGHQLMQVGRQVLHFCFLCNQLSVDGNWVKNHNFHVNVIYTHLLCLAVIPHCLIHIITKYVQVLMQIITCYNQVLMRRQDAVSSEKVAIMVLCVFRMSATHFRQRIGLNFLVADQHLTDSMKRTTLHVIEKSRSIRQDFRSKQQLSGK